MSRHVDHMGMVRLLGQGLPPADDELEQLDLDRNLDGIVAWAYTNLRQCKCPLGHPSVEFDVASTHQHNGCARGIYLRVIDNLRKIAPDDRVREALSKTGARPGARYNPPDRHEVAAAEIRRGCGHRANPSGRAPFITDMGESPVLTADDGSTITLGRYGVWKWNGRKHEVVETGDDLAELQRRHGIYGEPVRLRRP